MTEDSIIGTSAAIERLRAFISIAAKSDSHVLILGETGVGKELAARAIHYKSNRKEKPFIKVNSGSLNENLVESELFGHHRGAFTGALIDRAGLVEAANGGTFLFDEIGDIAPSIQARLLAVIEDKEVRRIGENAFRKVNTRFIFATHRDLFSLASRGRFRHDLFYRINILNFIISPLRDRISDIPYLAEEFLSRECSGSSIKKIFEHKALAKLCSYSYPGNVRELENIVKRAHALARNDYIGEEDIIFQSIPRAESKYGRQKGLNIRQIIDILVKHRGNKTKTARELGISRVHLYRLLNDGRNDIH